MALVQQVVDGIDCSVACIKEHGREDIDVVGISKGCCCHLGYCELACREQPDKGFCRVHTKGVMQQHAS